ncbi:hypothetical protein ACJZ2D_016610 [Fusarium nematophilum]
MSAPRSTFVRTPFYTAFKFDADRENTFSETNEAKHTKMRRKVAPGYYGKGNPNLESDVDKIVWELIKYITNKTHTTGRFDLADVAQYFTLDVITQLSLGQAFNFLSQDKDVFDFIKSTNDGFPTLFFATAVPFFARLLRMPTIQRLVFPAAGDSSGMGKIKEVANRIAKERFSPEQKDRRPDMVTTFISNGLTQQELADEAILQILAGSDTTSTTMRCGMLSIISSTRVYLRLVEEGKTANVPRDLIIGYRQAKELPFLHACVLESLRFHPPIAGLLSKTSPTEGYWHNDHYIPPGTQVGWTTWGLLRYNCLVFGEDADIFRPERWLEASDQTRGSMERTVELVFGSGRYKCLGEKLAKMELHKVFFEMVRRFEWSVGDPISPFSSDRNFALFMQKGLWVTANAT